MKFEFRVSSLRKPVAALLFLLALHPGLALACAACYGQSDSPMAKGMNWGILSLLGVVVFVLGSLGTFFVFIAKKSAVPPAETPAAPASESKSDVETKA